MITQLYGGPYSGRTIHLPQNTRYFAVKKHMQLSGEYRQYDGDGTHCKMIWLDPRDIEEAKKPSSKGERHAAQDLLRALREAREAGTQQAREEGARKAALIQAHWEQNMSDTMRARREIDAVRAQAAKEAAEGVHFDSSDEERWERQS
jgi:hypothetical protein